MKKILSLLGSLLILTACSQQTPAQDPNKVTVDTSTENSDSTTTGKFDLSNDKFETQVSGYLKTIEMEPFGEKINASYLVITDFKDEGFKTSIDETIQSGNTVNRKEGDDFLFNLGCFDKDDTSEMDEETKNALQGSTKDKSVNLTLGFEVEENGRGCICCHFAEYIKLIK